MKKPFILFMLSILFCIVFAGCQLEETDKKTNFNTQGERGSADGKEKDASSPSPDTKKQETEQENKLPQDNVLQAYKSILRKKKYNKKQDDPMERTYFAISDLDTNGIPELLISKGPNEMSISYYTYENGEVTKIDIPDDVDLCPAAGSLHRLPSRNSFAYFRGGPAYEDPDSPGNGYMPYTLIEYTIKNHQIHQWNYAFWQICNYGPHAGTIEYTLNEQKCPADRKSVV